MVVPRAVNGRWLRKYKGFFFIGLIILLFQVFLAINFFSISKNEWQSEGSTFDTNKPKAQPTRDLNHTNLRLEGLDFKPDCEITGKEAISAIHRATSQACKHVIANVTCLSLAGNLYPKQVTSTCPSEGQVYGKSLGCFKDESNFRLLKGYFSSYKQHNSPEHCIEICLQSGFMYAGVQYSVECFCGNEPPPSTSKLPDSSCNMKCPGDIHGVCGGYYKINVYQTGIKKFSSQKANTEVQNTDEPPVKIVFLLTLHGRALRQVKRLLKILYTKDHYYYIHVDIREDYLFRELLHLEKQYPNIRLTRRRFATIWGGASLLEMLLNCMDELLHLSWNWDFILNLSESDYPVKMIDSLQTFLTANKNKNFVKSHGRDTQRFLQKQGLDKTFVQCDLRMWRVADRKLPKGMQVDGGSDWIALSRNFVGYVATKTPDQLVSSLKKIFQHTLLPAESFFHTVLRNSHFCDSYIDNNLHVTNWKRKLGCKCQYKHIVDWCGCSPNDFRPEDWPRIESTSQKQLYFARKFEPLINQQVLLRLELWLHNLQKVSRRVTNLHAYWQSIYHHRDLSPPVDDGYITAFSSVGRLWGASVLNNTCVTLEKPLEAISYHYKDIYKYTLIQFKAQYEGKGRVIELAFKPINTTYLLTESALTKRLEELVVSSEYDQKEQISRNFARILSPYSDPVVIFKFAACPSGSTTVHNVSCLWIDPTGVLVDVTEISVDENAAVGFSKPTLKQPHMPGGWTVKFVSKKTLLAQVQFLVTPLEFYGGSAITKKQARLVHGGPSLRAVGEHFESFLSNGFDKDVLKETSVANANKTGDELRTWIDALFRKFFVVEKVCAHERDVSFCGVRMDECSRTNWSSYAPDPKSAIEFLNETTGRFHIW